MKTWFLLLDLVPMFQKDITFEYLSFSSMAHISIYKFKYTIFYLKIFQLLFLLCIELM